VIDENLGQKRPARTYQDLLSSAHDEALFTWHTTSQLARVTLEGEVTPLGQPGVLHRASPSPDAAWILVEVIHQPYSYLVPAGRFPRRLEVWDAQGQVVKQIADLPLAEDIPVAYSAVRKGPRSLRWRADAAAELCWVEALDEGDPAVDVPHRDQLFLWGAPFTQEPTAWIKLELRFAGLVWGRGDLAIAYESWWSTRHVRTWIAAPDTPTQAPRVLHDRSWEDRYSDPGSPMLRDNQWGRAVLRTTPDGQSIYMVGAGASPQGNRPFLDRLNLGSGDTERLWQSQSPWYEQPAEMLDDEGHKLITRRESTEVPPNYYLRDLRDGSLRPLTDFKHPFPQILGSTRELISYERADGVQLNARLHLPAGYDAERDGPLPVLVWAYPREFKDAQAAGQVRDSPHRFVGVGWWSPLLWLVRGWCVLDDATMPIIGEGDAEPNDTYVEQLVSSAQAALDEVARRGVGDPARAAVGGHSYGAFMTANLLAHSQLFKAGIARSGAYNRTLTPFGFQAEERTLWEAPETYIEVSPFMHADKISTPLLLIHGEADNNSGTYPMQTERFYKALKGHGATVRMVMLPHESHSYRARESILHMAWEMDRWLQRYVLADDPGDGQGEG
jgi:dipeptidyl aminopeptidase/acylaminoacyl peptidase